MDRAHELASKLTLRQKIAQTGLYAFKGYDDLPSELVEVNRRGELGNLLLFAGNNVRDLRQLRALNRRIQAHASESPTGIGYLISIDQEGGQLTAIHRGTTMFPGNMALGLAGDANLAELQGEYCGNELRYAGIQLCYAPVLDTSFDRTNAVPVVDNRTYSSLPEVVAAMGSAYARGLQKTGVAACGKHFPGMRILQEDTHFTPDTHPGSRERVEGAELVPFRRCIESGIDAIMMHHGVYPAFDAQFPASLSPFWYAYLRKTLGFRGLIVTDDLVMGAIVRAFGETRSAVLALAAGADLVMHTGLGSQYVDLVERAVEAGEIPVSRVEEACLAVLSMKVKTLENAPAPKSLRPSYGKKLAASIARRAIRLSSDSRVSFPLATSSSTRIGILSGNPARLVMSDAINLYDAKSIATFVREKTKAKTIKEMFMPWRATKMEILSLVDIGTISDVCLFIAVNAYEYREQLEVLKQLRSANPEKTIVGVASRSPDDAGLLRPYCDAVFVTGGWSEPLVEALVEAIFREPFAQPIEKGALF